MPVSPPADAHGHGHNINNMIHATTYMSSEKEAALGLPQLGRMFIADSDSWNVNETPNSISVRQMLKNTEPAGC